MTVDIDRLFQRDAFKGIEPGRLDALKKFAARINGRAAAEIIPIFMRFSGEMSKSKAFSKQETEAMLAAINEALPEAERPKLQNIIKLFAGK